MSRYIMEIMVTVTLNYHAIHSHFRFYSGKIKPQWDDVYFTGTASVIIALTDGELNDYQFVTAQQEASTQASNVTMDVACSLADV